MEDRMNLHRSRQVEFIGMGGKLFDNAELAQALIVELVGGARSLDMALE